MLTFFLINLKKSPNGDRLASADDDGRIRIASINDQEPKIRAFRAKHENIVSCVEWANDQIIASAR